MKQRRRRPAGPRLLVLGTLSLQLAFLLSVSGCAAAPASPHSTVGLNSPTGLSVSAESSVSQETATVPLAAVPADLAEGPSEKFRFPSNKGFQPPVPTAFQFHPPTGAFQSATRTGTLPPPTTAGTGTLELPARTGSRGTAAVKAGWKWPLTPRPAVIRSFDPPAQPWLSGHRGVDLAAPPGSIVIAPAGGIVTFAGWVVDRPVLTITHPDGLRSSFEPVESGLSAGTAVAADEAIGTVAASRHCAPADCLHWGVRRGADYIDPLQFVTDRRPSILLPLDAS
ncbi:peptidoglycan DD-metalloendopeptidase family protein [Paenarthrobacter sp. PH39-S1]|uniref:M23 family metallopeptidase n=1 Tax=Paenarthrobacter sp. PH39-S1 TaxID=3046204 RepID=UPI0032D95E53